MTERTDNKLETILGILKLSAEANPESRRYLISVVDNNPEMLERIRQGQGVTVDEGTDNETYIHPRDYYAMKLLETSKI